MAISLCMITKNEEKNIERCLNSVKDLVDEMIIIDTGSTDRTKEICKKFAAEGKFFDFKIFDFKWCDDFSAARNFGLQYATKDWILVLDADEALDKNGIKEIKELAKKESDFDAYLMPQINYSNNRQIAGFKPADNNLLHRFEGHYVSMICRLFKNKKNYRFSGIVHELVEPSIKEKNGRLAVSNVLVHHFGNADEKETKKKKEYYLKLSKEKVRKSPSGSSYFELGILHKETGNLNEAINALNKVIELNSKHDAALYELGIIHEIKKELDNAIKYYTDSLKIKNSAEAFFCLGSCYLKKGGLKKAFRNLTKSLLLNPNNYKVYNNLSVVHEKNHNHDEAIKILEIGTKLNPKNSVGFYNLGINYDKIGNKEKALESFEKARSLGHKNEELIEQRIKELKQSLENATTFNYSFDVGN